jgi:hypothetical protein
VWEDDVVRVMVNFAKSPSPIDVSSGTPLFTTEELTDRTQLGANAALIVEL